MKLLSLTHTNRKYFCINYVSHWVSCNNIIKHLFLVPVVSYKYYHQATAEANVTEMFLPTYLTTKTVLLVTITLIINQTD